MTLRLPAVRTSLAVGLTLRLGVVLAALRDPAIPVKPDDYLAMGRRFLETGRLADPVFPPGYPAICAAATALAGESAVVAVLLLQMACGGGAILLAAHLAGRLGERAGRAAACVTAIEPLLVVATGFVLTEDLYAALLLAALTLAFAARDRSGGRDASGELGPAVLAGLLAGAAILVRSVGIVALVPLPFVAAGGAPGRRVARAGVLLLAAALVVLPWCARNLAVHGRFAPSASGTYNFAALVVGPARAVTEGIPAEANLSIWERGTVPTADPWSRAEAAKREAARWARSHPVELFRALAVSQVRLWFGPGRSNLAELSGSPPPRWLLAALVALRVALLAGAALGTAKLLRGRNPLAVPLLLLVLLHVLPAGSAGYSRFLRPALPLVVILFTASLAGREIHFDRLEKTE